MLVKQELINKIKDYFGLNIYETKVWLALIGKGIATAGEVAEISGVPRSRTYDVLESLDKMGFALVKLGKPVKYIGVKPAVILEKLKNNVREESKERMIGLSKIKETDEFQNLEKLYNSGIDPVKREEISAALKGRSNISNYLREIIQNASKEVIICTNVEDILNKTKLFLQTFNDLKKGDIKMNIALSGDEKLIKKASDVFGIKFKKTNIKAKFFIIDRKEAMFYIAKDQKNLKGNNEDTAVWLNSEFFAEAFASLFEKAVNKEADKTT